MSSVGKGNCHSVVLVKSEIEMQLCFLLRFFSVTNCNRRIKGRVMLHVCFGMNTKKPIHKTTFVFLFPS